MGEDGVWSDNQRAGNTITALGLCDSNVTRDKTTDGCKHSASLTKEEVEKVNPWW